MFLHEFYAIISTKLFPLLSALIGFGGIIAIHESGHFLFCKLFGILTPTFSIGFGPELFRKQIGSTNFRLALIPLGGYVEMAGSAEIGQGKQEYAQATGDISYDSKPYWQKFLVSMGGILFNMIFAYLVFCGLFFWGTSDKQAIIIADVLKDSPAQLAGIKPGDAILAINKIPLLDHEDNLVENAQDILLNAIRAHPNQKIGLTIIPADQSDEQDIAVPLGSRQEEGQTIGSFGAKLRAPLPKLPFFKAIAAGVSYTNQNIRLNIEGIKRIFTQGSLQGVGGPLVIASTTFSSAQNGLVPLLIFLALMSINLALLNVLPIGALDGGQLLFVTIEALIRRRLSQTLKNIINLASIFAFIGLTLFLSYRDFLHFFGERLAPLYERLLNLF